MTRSVQSGVLSVVTGVVAALISVGRLLLANHFALTNLVWAEDGLFPLCVTSHNVVSCAIDPFAGYLLVLQRLVAWPVSAFPMMQWPLVTNVAAALLAGISAALVFILLRANGCGLVASVFVGLLPVLVPMMGFEAINSIGSSYMLLTYLCALAICLPPQRKFPTVAYSCGALLLALTIPSSAVLLFPLVSQAASRRVPRRSAIIVGIALILGLAGQSYAALTAENPRSVHFTLDALKSWAETMPSALLTFWPGPTSLTLDGSFTSASAAAWGALGIGICVAVLILGIALITLTKSRVRNGIGLLLLVALALGALPAAAGYANNRYFVLPALLWAAAVIIALDRGITWKTEGVMALIAGVLIIAWIPGLKVSPFRSTAVPEWRPMLEAAMTHCHDQPDSDATITFSPSWPFQDAVFPGPTNNIVSCSVLGGR